MSKPSEAALSAAREILRDQQGFHGQLKEIAALIQDYAIDTPYALEKSAAHARAVDDLVALNRERDKDAARINQLRSELRRLKANV